MERLPLLNLLGLPIWGMTFLGYGTLIVRPFRLTWSDRRESLLLSTIAGAGFFCLLIGIVGLAGWLYPSVIWPILLTGIALALWEFRAYLEAATLVQSIRRGRDALKSYLIGLPRWQQLVLALLVATICLNLIIALGPPIEGDALSQYLAIPKIFVREHRLFFFFPASNPILLWKNFDNVTPLSLQMLSAAGLATGSESFALLGNRLIGLLLLLLIAQFARRLGFPRAALLAGAIFYMTGLSNYQGRTAKVEVGAGLFEVAAIYSLWVWYARRKEVCLSGEGNGWLYLSGLFLGYAISVRQSGIYTGLLMTLFLLGSMVLLHPRRLRLIEMVAWSLVAACAGSIWLIVTYWYTRNPLFPALGGFFGTGQFTGQILPPGINRGVIGMFQMFAAMSLGPVTGGWGLVESIGPLFVTLVPAIAYTAYRLRHRGYVLLVAYVLTYYTLWFHLYAVTRLMTAAVAVAAVLAGIALAYVLERSPRFARTTLQVVVLGAFVVNLGLNLIIARHYLPHAFGLESREAFLSKMFSRPGREPSWALIEYVNSTSAEYRRILAIPWSHSYFLDNTDLIRYVALTMGQDDNPIHPLEQAGFTHVWLNDWSVHELETLGTSMPDWVSALLASDQLQLEFADEATGQYLFRIDYDKRLTDRSHQPIGRQLKWRGEETK